MAAEITLLLRCIPDSYFEGLTHEEKQLKKNSQSDWEFIKLSCLESLYNESSSNVDFLVKDFSRWCSSDINKLRQPRMAFKDVYLDGKCKFASKSPLNNCYCYAPFEFKGRISKDESDRFKQVVNQLLRTQMGSGPYLLAYT